MATPLTRAPLPTRTRSPWEAPASAQPTLPARPLVPTSTQCVRSPLGPPIADSPPGPPHRRLTPWPPPSQPSPGRKERAQPAYSPPRPRCVLLSSLCSSHHAMFPAVPCVLSQSRGHERSDDAPLPGIRLAPLPRKQSRKCPGRCR